MNQENVYPDVEGRGERNLQEKRRGCPIPCMMFPSRGKRSEKSMLQRRGGKGVRKDGKLLDHQDLFLQLSERQAHKHVVCMSVSQAVTLQPDIVI